MMIGADKGAPRGFGFHKSIGVAAVTQFNGRNGLIYSQRSKFQKGSILGQVTIMVSKVKTISVI